MSWDRHTQTHLTSSWFIHRFLFFLGRAKGQKHNYRKRVIVEVCKKASVAGKNGGFLCPRILFHQQRNKIKFSFRLFCLLYSCNMIIFFLSGTKRRENMNHYQIWHAIDLFAKDCGLSCSALAKLGGLDATTFNKSKRVSAYGQPRWPSTYSIAKILAATGATMTDFCKFIKEAQAS